MVLSALEAATPEAAASKAVRFARAWQPSRANAAASVVEREASGRRFHSVAFHGGGFAVVAGESNDVIAFSPSGELGDDDGGPLWTLIKRDLSIRAAGSSVSTLDESPLPSVPDIRVPALVKSKWGQTTAGGYNSYNYYTPKHYHCGCVATSLAQLMRFHEFPTAETSVQAKTFNCKTNNVTVALTMMGGAYDWSSMPLDPTSSSTDAERQAIGKLCHDAGVPMHMEYGPGGSSAILPLSSHPLKNLFKYSSAASFAVSGSGNIDSSTFAGAVYPSLDAGYPVLLGITDGSAGHAVIADGYGYSDGVLYTHLNMGWSGNNDVWYNLPSVPAASYSFTAVNSIVYNIFPTNTGEIVSGRITDQSNNPIEGATITASRNSATYTATSNSNGIYALILPASKRAYYTYTLTAEMEGMSSESLQIRVLSSVGLAITDNLTDDFSYNINTSTMRCGNLWGNDFILVNNQDSPKHFYVSATGSDWNDGSENEPFATIAAAVEAASDGDEITVAPGVFAPFTSDGKRITITAAEGPSATVIDGRYAASCFEDLQGTTNTVISGFTLRRGYCIMEGGGAYGGTLVNCVVEKCHSDRYGGGAYGALLVNCTLSQNSAYSCGAAENCDIVHCTVMGNSAMDTSGGVGGSCNATESIIFGNIVSDIGEYNFPIGSANIGAFVNCCVRPIPPTGSGCFAESPMVVDSHNGDFRLREGSPCIVENGHDIGAVEDACVQGHVVSLWTYCGGTADSYTKVVEDGGTAAFRFSGREVAHLYTNDVETAASDAITLSDITGDIIVDAVFTNYTYHVSENGSDSNSGLSEESPFATIQHAVDISAEYDTILVHPGTYPRFSAAGRSVDIVSTDGPYCTTIDGESSGRSVFLDFYLYVNSYLEGFTITGGTGDYGGGVFGGMLYRCIISDNNANSSGGGAFGVTAYSSLIANNVAGSVNTTSSNGGGAYESYLINCTVANNHTSASRRSYGAGAYNSTVLNSIIYGNSILSGSSSSIEEYGCMPNNSFIGIDPGFSDPANGDFSLTSGSCAIDAGCEAYLAGNLDLAGNPRIQRETIDAGCYEFFCPIWISPSDTAISANPHSGSLTVRTSGDWTIECDADWLSLGMSSGSGTATVNYTVSANRTGTRRYASITATDSGRNQADATIEQIEAVPYKDWHGGHARYGLFVGVNEYSFIGKSQWLNGCVADAENLFAAFTSPRSYWTAENCTVLTNSAATSAAIRGALTNLAERAQSGDTVVYTHSSHGTSEADGSLNTYLYSYNGPYSDADIAADLALFREGVNVIVIVDACNSGGLFKDSYAQEDALLPIAENVSAIMEATAAENGISAALMGEEAPASANIGWITAADYHQYSWDSETAVGGEFTSRFIEGWSTELSDADGNGYFDFLELFRYAAGKATGRQNLATTAQAYNEPLLLRTIAGHVDFGFRFILK